MPKKIIQIVLLGLILIGLPLISWYYLQSGLDFRKSKLEEMEKLGKLASFEFALLGEERKSSTFLEDKLTLIAFDTIYSEEDLYKFSTVYEPFQDRMDLVAIAAGPGLSTADPYVDGIKHDFALLKTDNDSPLYKQMMSLAEEKASSIPMIALIDKDLEIRNIYPLHDKEAMNLLMEHVAILIPTLKYGKDDQSE